MVKKNKIPLYFISKQGYIYKVKTPVRSPTKNFSYQFKKSNQLAHVKRLEYGWKRY